MPSTRVRTVTLGPKAMAELFRPLRLELYESLQAGGAASVAELAQRLGRPADSLYYHVKKLLRIGVIEPVDGPERSGPGRRGVVYSADSIRVDVQLDQLSRKSREAWAQGAAAVLRLARRDFAAALESRQVRLEGPRRDLVLRRTKVRLSEAQARRVNALLDELQEALGGYAENRDGDLFAVTYVMTPLETRSEA